MKRYIGLALMVALLTSLACAQQTQSLVDTPTPAITATSVPAATATPEPTATPVPTATSSPTPEPTHTPDPVVDSKPLSPDADAQELISAALDAMDALDTVHFSLEAEIGMGSEGLTATFPFRFEGDYQSPDRVRGKIALSLGFISLEMQIINIGQDSYITDPQTGLWKQTDGNAMGELTPTEFTGLTDDVRSLELSVVGEETLEDGTAVLHLVALTTRESGVDGPTVDLTTDIYVGLEDSLIRQVVVEGAIPLDPAAIANIIPGLPIPLGGGGGGGNATISMTTTFSAFNEPVEIEAPVVE
ncbi:MAG: hypothetical protein IIC85_03965 [Chloroflexi bacterium]|nr:hypothetical protein [Chloroflexota bacterium]